MNFTPANLLNYRDSQYATARGYLTFRLYSDGWMVRHTPNDESLKTEKIEGADIYSACAFANDRA